LPYLSDCLEDSQIGYHKSYKLMIVPGPLVHSKNLLVPPKRNQSAIPSLIIYKTQMTTPYEGPSRHEILSQIMRYNSKHHKIDSILISNVSKTELAGVEQIEKKEKNASQAVGQLDVLIKELEELRRSQTGRSGPSSSRGWARRDRAQVVAALKKVVEHAEKERLKCDVRERQAVQFQFPARDQFPGRVQIPARVQSPPPIQIHPPPHTQAGPSAPKAVGRPRPEVKQLQPQTAPKPAAQQPHTPQMPEAKEQQRKFIIEQHAIMAQIAANKLHDELKALKTRSENLNCGLLAGRKL
jgi:hypothetical protein